MIKVQNRKEDLYMKQQNYNNATSKDNEKLKGTQSPLKSYEIVERSSIKCILKTQSSVSKVPCDIENVINENSNMESVFDKVPSNKPSVISNVPFSTSIRILPPNSKQEMSLNQSASDKSMSTDLLSKSQISVINESLNNLLSESQISIANESLNNELNWGWDGNTLVVPQCENINEQLENSTFESDTNNNNAMLNNTLESIEKINLDDSQQTCKKQSVVYFPTNDLQNDDDSHSEYIPSEHSSEEHDEQDVSNNRSANKSLRKSNSSNNSVNSGLNISLTTNVRGKSSRNDEEMYVQSAPPKGSKRIFRKHFCLFCKTWQSKIGRHLERKHKNEKRVKDFTDLPKKSNERKRFINMLRREGDFYYNVNNDVNSGELIVCRRPAEKCKNTAQDYVCCPKCKGFFNKLNLRHHTAHCIDQKRKGSKVCPVLSRQVIGRYASQAENILRQIVMPRCHEDRITRIIRYDQLIMEHGNKLCLKYPSPHHHNMIRQRLRQLGRFLLEIRQHCQDIDDLSSVYHPKYYGLCIDVINTLAGFDISTKTYNTPSLATSLGTLLKATGKTLVSLTIFQDNIEKQKQVENFLTLLSNEYGTAVNKVALESQLQVKRKKKVVLPSIDDIKKLDSFLKIQRTAAFQNLEQKFSFQDWLKLSESTLISIMLFNRQKAGEMERTLIEDYKNYEKFDPKTNADGFNALSSECQKLAMEYVRFTIRGKLSRTVPVLLDSELQKCVELILQHRKKAGVSLTNPYVFGTPNIDRRKHTYLQACNLMRRFSFECGADRPETLRGTTLRKHVATLGVNLNLTDSEITDLANFMGHEEKIHREHYRMPIVHREILRMSRLLYSASGKDHENKDNFNDEEENDTNINNFENDVAFTSNCNYNISLKSSRNAMQNKENQQNKKSRKKLLQNLPVDSHNTTQTNSSDSYSSDTDTDTSEKYFSQKKRRSTSPYGKCKRIPWSETEKKIVLDAFGRYIPQKKLPSLYEIQELIKKNPIALERRTAVMIKAWLMNQKQKQKQKSTKS
ncbi:uncharacterized protein LOC143908752 isoform X2 [Temnothorax americanus]